MPDSAPKRTLPLIAVIGVFTLVFLATLALLIGDAIVAIAGICSAIVEGACATAIVISAGGFGFLVIRRIWPAASIPLSVMTACGLGLWILSTAVLIVGSLIPGSLGPAIWWPVVIAGVALAIWQGRQAIKAWHPGRIAWSHALALCLLAAAGAIWLAGALRPPGTTGVLQGDSYDVLEYHLQVPREACDAGQIMPLEHNCYSFFPLGVEMLYLLGMCLRGGAYEGMYLAQMMHGVFGVLAVIAAWTCLRGNCRLPIANCQSNNSDSSRERPLAASRIASAVPVSDDGPRSEGILAALLLATSPGLLYLSWIAKTELAQVFYLMLALLWLRAWLADKSYRAALCAGLMLGAACATKYVAVGMVALPVLAVMLTASLRSRQRFVSTILAGAATLALLSPWLIRNAATVGNPVFPLANKVLGHGYWSVQEQERFNAGHAAAENLPPVPKPKDWSDPPRTTIEQRFWRDFLISRWFAPFPFLWLLLVVVATPAIRRNPAWPVCLLGVLAVQLIAWVVGTHEMPWRFLSPVSVPIALLGALSLAALSDAWKENDKPSTVRWPTLAMIVFLFMILFTSVHLALSSFQDEVKATGPLPPYEGSAIATQVPAWSPAWSLPSGSKILLVGQAQAFYFPPGTVYATTFDPNPLAQIASSSQSPEETLARLKKMGVTHIWVDWQESWRLACTYGLASPLSEELFQCHRLGQKPAFSAVEKLRPLGLKELPAGETPTFDVRPLWDLSDKSIRWPVRSLYSLP